MENPHCITKTKLAKHLNLSVRTIYNYHDVAILWINEFESDYPLKGKESLTKVPLTHYQAWVIFKLTEIGKNFPRINLPSILTYFDFSKAEYLRVCCTDNPYTETQGSAQQEMQKLLNPMRKNNGH